MKVADLINDLHDLELPDAEVMVGSIQMNYATAKPRVSEPVLDIWTEDGQKRVFLEIAGKDILPV